MELHPLWGRTRFCRCCRGANLHPWQLMKTIPWRPWQWLTDYRGCHTEMHSELFSIRIINSWIVMESNRIVGPVKIHTSKREVLPVRQCSWLDTVWGDRALFEFMIVCLKWFASESSESQEYFSQACRLWVCAGVHCQVHSSAWQHSWQPEELDRLHNKQTNRERAVFVLVVVVQLHPRFSVTSHPADRLAWRLLLDKTDCHTAKIGGDIPMWNVLTPGSTYNTAVTLNPLRQLWDCHRVIKEEGKEGAPLCCLLYLC